MKHLKKSFALVLVLCILLGLMPAGVSAAEASAYAGEPTADIVQVVIDYGKTVEIAVSEIKAGIHLNGNGSLGNLVGFVSTGSSGELLSSAPTPECNAVGKILALTPGTLTWKDVSTVSYEPQGILSDVVYFYAVYALSDNSSYSHIKVEIQVIPSSLMYYEAEELADSGDLDTVDVPSKESEGASWADTSEGNSADDLQEYDGIDTVSNMVIDRKNIPPQAFFADFDGTGKSNRYSKDSIYWKKGTTTVNDFDSNSYWNGNGTDTVSTTPGYLRLQLDSTKQSHYVQTVTSGGNHKTQPLNMKTGMNHYVQIRFRLENCQQYGTGNPSFRLYLSDSATENISSTSGDYLSVSLSGKKEALFNGEYITVTASLGSIDYYKNAIYIDAIRPYFNNIEVKSGSTGYLYIDYIYIGGLSGLTMATIPSEAKYLYFNFDRTYTDSHYYSSIYGSSDTNFNSANNWATDESSDSDCKVARDTDGSMEISGGTKYTSSNLYYYRFIHTGSTVNSRPLNYTSATTDVCRIRIKATGGSYLDNSYSTKVRIRIEYYLDDGTHVYGEWYDIALTKFENGEYNTYTFAFHDTDLKGSSYKIKAIRPTIGYYKGGTINFSYVYIGPESTLSEINPTTDNYLYMDFTNTHDDNIRHSNPAYKYYNHDINGTWSYRDDTYYTKSFSTSNGGTVTLTDKMAEVDEESDKYANLYIRTSKLNFPAGDNHYFQMRLKIDNATKDSDSNPRLTVDYKVSGDDTVYYSSATAFNLNDVKGKGYFILTVKMSGRTKYQSGSTITQLTPIIGGTQGAKVTIDYIYLGPASAALATNSTTEFSAEPVPANEALYFGFSNSTTDQDRYITSGAYFANDTYNSSNYDTGTWTVSGTGSGISYNSTKGIASITVGTSDYGGPILTSGTLKYHPYNADVLQTRFRLNGCRVDPNGNPRLEAKITGYLGTTSTTHTITRLFADTNNFQSITIPMKSELQKFTTVTKIVLQFYDIQGGTLEIDHIYLGDGTASGVPTYGYDSAYTNDSMLSDGKSLYVVGHGSRQDPKVADLESGKYVYPEKYTEASFSFTGTGFDIISRTGAEQGTIRVGIYTDPRTTEESRVRTVTMNCLGDLELYQIPVVSVQGLAHGTYYVRINVSAGVTFPGIGTLIGKEFHLDAIRIYDPIDVSKTTLTKNQRAALDAYRRDKEAYSYIKEIRDTLLSVADFTAALLGNGTNGALFVDSTIEVTCPEATDETIEVTDATEPTSESAEVITDHRVVTAADYKDMGPKNEVYLSPGQAIAFKLEKDSTEAPVSVDIGAKTVQGGESAVLSAGFVATVGSNALTTVSSTKWNVNSASAQYFALDESKLSAGTDIYLVIYNAHTGTDKTKNILSITDLKVCYAQKPARTDLPQDGTSAVEVPVVGAKRTKETEAEPFHFAVDGRTMEAAEVYLNAKGETPVEESTEPVGDIHIYHSLNLASDISVNYLIPVQELQDFDTFKMELRIPVYEGDTLVGYRTESPEPVEKDGFWYFTVNGLAAIHMNDVMEATLCMTKGETTTFSSTDFYSIAQYAYGQLSKEGVSDRLKTLCADLLVYGAKAQLFKGYRTDAPADMTMTEEERAYCTDLTAVTFGNNNQVLEDLPDPVVLWKGKSLVLDSRVCLQYIVDLSAYEGSAEELCLRLTYRDHQGQTQTAILTDPAVYNGDLGWYSFTFDGLLAAELRSVVDGAVFCGDTQVSQTLRYSADTYGNHKTGLLADLCKALFAYSDSAKAFFHN